MRSRLDTFSFLGDKFSDKVGPFVGPYLSPKALAIAHSHVQVDGAIPRALFMCSGHNWGSGQVQVDEALAKTMAKAMARAMAVAMARATARARRTRARAKDRARARDGRTDGRAAGRSYLFCEMRNPACSY